METKNTRKRSLVKGLLAFVAIVPYLPFWGAYKAWRDNEWFWEM